MNGCNYDSVKCYLQKQAPSVELWFVDPSENLSHSKLFETEELTHRKRLWCWEGLGAGEGDNRGWDGWMASQTQWTWVWGNSRSWWWTGRPDVLQFMGLQRVRQDWATEMNWTELNWVNLIGWRKWGVLRQIPAPIWEGGETYYTGQEDMEFINRHGNH